MNKNKPSDNWEERSEQLLDEFEKWGSNVQRNEFKDFIAQEKEKSYEEGKREAKEELKRFISYRLRNGYTTLEASKLLETLDSLTQQQKESTEEKCSCCGAPIKSCLLCSTSFYPNLPHQKFCKPSHKVMYHKRTQRRRE